MTEKEKNMITIFILIIVIFVFGIVVGSILNGLIKQPEVITEYKYINVTKDCNCPSIEPIVLFEECPQEKNADIFKNHDFSKKTPLTPDVKINRE